MLPGSDLPSLRPVLTVQALAPLDRTGDPRQESLSRLMQVAVGQTLQGKIMSLLEDGSYLVKIADTTARMQLPAGVKAGESLSLTMLSKVPRPTFLLQQDGDSAPALLSHAGRLIDQLVKATASAGPPFLQGETPLLDSAPPASRQATAIVAAARATEPAAVDVRMLAASLKAAVAGSGLFYESHVAQWADGRLSIDDIQREPQARHGTHFQPDLLGSDGFSDPRHAQVAAIIAAQLDTLENTRFTWRGDAWPGQQMEWEVERQDQERHPAQRSPEPVWQSSVRFELSHLGAVAASIRLCGNRLQMQVHAETPDAALALKSNASGLADAMASAGLLLDGLIVNRHADSET